MNIKEIDKIFITNLPAFYKINLFNEIAKKENIHVIFTGNTAEMRNNDFFKTQLINFPYTDLSKKSKISKTLIFLKFFFNRSYSEVIIGGWDEWLMWLALFLSPRRKNSAIVESSIYESSIVGTKAFFKKIFFKKISKVYASGKNQTKLVYSLKFKGAVIETKGVGIFNIRNQPPFIGREKIKNFLYVGRLATEKNVSRLIEVFNQMPEFELHVVGFGPLENDLKNLAENNIRFHGAIKNEELYRLYSKYDVFILPSTIEPWGLVVEEALNNGMPVIASNKVGCVGEVLIDNFNGMVFNSDDMLSLKEKISQISIPDNYNYLRENISKMDFKKIALSQTNAYLS
ncbi:glycosyltransferase family 4 protein [uncultured Chryseobacterium sp.]|uniref:glycosyltransferase family 4 protein n=1 Tax=uncultured Chryseobacterium sp. TaxID=259322 RepID=UPI0025DE1A59|nr:glycosyltransferase [uncultured Chryseobacterium sp.]